MHPKPALVFVLAMISPVIPVIPVSEGAIYSLVSVASLRHGGRGNSMEEKNKC
jgi:hypothetical protein